MTYQYFRGEGEPHDDLNRRPPPPPWRDFARLNPDSRAGEKPKPERPLYCARAGEIEAVNAALCLRRPLLLQGKPGVGKSTLAKAVAYELNLGEVLEWPITSRSVVQQGLYSYDAIGRLHAVATDAKREAKSEDATSQIEKFLRLGPLGSALVDSTDAKPRVLLIDEIDKGDSDLPNDLLHLFETGRFDVPELGRLTREPGAPKLEILMHDGKPCPVPDNGKFQGRAFPLVFLTSNGERVFPPAFLRRCLKVDLREPNAEELEKIVNLHLDFAQDQKEAVDDLIAEFLNLRDKERNELATDQLLNAAYLFLQAGQPTGVERADLKQLIFRSLTESEL